MASSSRYHGGRGRGRSRHYNNPCRIFVGNISYRIKEPELKDFFSEFGPVLSCEIVRDYMKGWSIGIGFVTFKEAESAQLALQAPDEKLVLDDRIMHTSEPRKPKRQKAREEKDMAEESKDIQEEREQGENVPSPAAFDDRSSELTDDVLHIVFCYLNLKDRIRVERVCKQWNRVARQWWKSAKTLHFRNTFERFLDGLTDDILHSIFKRGCHELKTLDLSASPSRLTNYSVELIAMYCPNLEQLDLSGVNATQQSFKQLTTSCEKIKWFKAYGSHYIGEKCLWWAMHNWSRLEYLDVSKNKRITGQCFYVAGETLRTVLLADSSVTDAGLILLTQHCPQLQVRGLQVLDISLCDQLSGGAIRSVCENCHQLTELYLTGPNSNVKTSDLMTLGHLKKLEVLKLSKQIACKDEVLSMLARNCQKLRFLSCEACYEITDDGLKSLVACDCLRHLNISYCHHITDEGLMRLSGKGVLEHLIAKACQAITDTALCCLAETCLNLRELDISGCLNITNKTLYAFQESILHMRQGETGQFSIVLGGTAIDRVVARQFAADTGTSLSLHDLSVRNLSADYDHFIDFSEECWEDDDEPHTFTSADQVDSRLEFMEREAELMVGDHGSSHYGQKAEDFLLADDPALFSDEFSDPED